MRRKPFPEHSGISWLLAMIASAWAIASYHPATPQTAYPTTPLAAHSTGPAQAGKSAVHPS